jgi:hypothetical protein
MLHFIIFNLKIDVLAAKKKARKIRKAAKGTCF